MSDLEKQVIITDEELNKIQEQLNALEPNRRSTELVVIQGSLSGSSVKGWVTEKPSKSIKGITIKQNELNNLFNGE